MNDEYFHGNCENTREHTTISEHGRQKKGHIRDKFCTDHQIAFCKCGWEWGHHFGTQTKRIGWRKELIVDNISGIMRV